MIRVTAHVFEGSLKKSPLMLKSLLFNKEFYYIDGHGEIVRNLMVHHPIPIKFKNVMAIKALCEK